MPARYEPGITPADAGKTASADFFVCLREDHPRGCGENLRTKCVCILNRGSPPRMRGKLRYNLAKVIQIRITPADAGKTAFVFDKTKRPGDHPRGCGENQKAQNELQQWVGSPPRMRGKPRNTFVVYSSGRITPADAGKTMTQAEKAYLR